MKASRRGLFSIAGAGLVAAGPIKAPETDPTIWGLNVCLRRCCGWEVAVIDDSYDWFPGMPPPLKWIPLEEFLRCLEKECGIVRNG